jgi:hypothetical protein
MRIVKEMEDALKEIYLYIHLSHGLKSCEVLLVSLTRYCMQDIKELQEMLRL